VGGGGGVEMEGVLFNLIMRPRLGQSNHHQGRVRQTSVL